MHTMPLDHAKQKLIFYVAQDLDQTIKSDVQQLVKELAASRVWSIAPPNLIDEIDENGLEVGCWRFIQLCRRTYFLLMWT